MHAVRFSHSKIVICNDDGLPRSTGEARPSKARPGIVMPPTNIQDDEEPMLSLQNAVLMVSFNGHFAIKIVFRALTCVV